MFKITILKIKNRESGNSKKKKNLRIKTDHMRLTVNSFSYFRVYVVHPSLWRTPPERSLMDVKSVRLQWCLDET